MAAEISALGSAYFRLCFPASFYLSFFFSKQRFVFCPSQRERVESAQYKAEATPLPSSSIPSSVYPSLRPSNNRINKHLYSALERRRRKGTPSPPKRCSLTASLTHSSLPSQQPSIPCELDCQAEADVEAEAAIFSPLFPFVVKLLYSIRRRRRRRLGIKQREGEDEEERARDRFLPPFPRPGSP